jgi:hypothetical protein
MASSGVCMNYKCPIEGCKNYYFNCTEHKCDTYGCYCRKAVGSNACYIHICDKYACRSAKLSGFNYCITHITFNDLVKVAQKERPYVPNDIWNLISKYNC